MRVLVLQLCRLGDILQTTPMLRGVRRLHPGAEVTIVVHEAFADVPVPRDLYDHRQPFPATTLGSELAREPTGWRRQRDALAAFLSELGPEAFDLTLNLTHSDLSGLLAAAIPTREVRGGLVAHDRTRVVRGPWMTYFWSSQTCRELGCFNLVDIHNATAAVPPEGLPLEIAIDAAAQKHVDGWLDARGLASQPLIAVQLGASDERKRWPPERFAEAVSRLDDELGAIVLVGAAAERDRAERFKARATRPVHDAVGTTSLPELAALLARCRLLATNDTGTMHVAAAVDTRVVDVSTGPVFVHETGPYGEGHLVIEPTIDCFPCTAGSECHHISCRDRIDPRDVAGLIAYALDAGPLPRPQGATILRGRFGSTGRLGYEPAEPGRTDEAAIVRRAMASVWERTLPVGDWPGGARPRYTVQPARSIDGGRSGCATRLTEAAASADAIASIAARIPGASHAERSRLGQETAAAMQRLRLEAELEPAAKPFVAFLKVRLDSVTEPAVGEVAGIYVEELRQTARRLRLLAEALDEPMRRSA